MSVIKVENADHQSSNPLMFDVMSADESATEPLATHVLKFGDFVLLDSLENIKTVSPAEKAERDAKTLAEAQAVEHKAMADNKAAQEGQAQTLSAARVDYAEAPARLKRKDLEDMTKAQLEEVADDHDVDVNQHMTKDEMIDAILKGQ